MRVSTVVWSVFLGGLTATASAQVLSGSIINATTQKPAAGDEVALLNFSSGIQEVARTQSDLNGSFTFKLDDMKQLRMLRVIHQGASYYKVVPPDTSSLQLDLYNVSKKVNGIVVTADVTRFQATGGALQAVRLCAVKK